MKMIWKMLSLLFVILFSLGLAQATINCTAIHTNADDSDATSYITSSKSPAAGKLQVFWFLNTKASSPQEPTSVSGDGLTFVKVGTAITPGNTLRINLYRAQSGSTSTGSITVDFGGGNTQT